MHLRGLPIRWWIAGGWALDLHAGEQTRAHKDVDVAVLRGEHEALRRYLADWEFQIAHGGELRPWRDGAVALPANAVWGRPRGASEWLIDFKIEQHDETHWIYRRDPTARRPLATLGTVVDGIPVLAEDVVRLYARRPPG